MNNGMNFSLPDGFRLGQVHNERTGVTVIVCEAGATGGVDVRGGAPGTRETDLLSPYKMMDQVHAVVLSGGSAYGLESCCGVMRYLSAKGIGFPVAENAVVPIVPGAVIFDLNGEGYDFPDIEMGRNAAEAAFGGGPIEFGRVGAGRGATVAKIYGAAGAQPGGVGGAAIRMGNVLIAAVVVVNALGEIYDHASMKKLVGATPAKGTPQAGQNTTVGCIMTNAKLDKVQTNKLAALAHNGLARSIKPIHTDYDGDTLFALSSGTEKIDFTSLGELAAEVTALAVENAVKR